MASCTVSLSDNERARRCTGEATENQGHTLIFITLHIWISNRKCTSENSSAVEHCVAVGHNPPSPVPVYSGEESSKASGTCCEVL